MRSELKDPSLTPDQLADLESIVTELLTNAVDKNAGFAEVALWQESNGDLVVVVSDDLIAKRLKLLRFAWLSHMTVLGQPLLPRPKDLQLRGRGLFMVGRLSTKCRLITCSGGERCKHPRPVKGLVVTISAN